MSDRLNRSTFWPAFFRREDGSAAAEFAIWLGVLTVPVLNAADISFYAYQAMQVRQAAQTAAQTAFSLCNGQAPPIATSCSGLNSALVTALASNGLGSNITWATSPASSEGWYCVDGTGALVISGSAETISPKGSNSGSMSSTQPSCTQGKAGDYVALSVTYTYKPIFKNLSIVTNVLPATITQTAWMRVN
jgi:Flp pilus assembly protein TadG